MEKLFMCGEGKIMSFIICSESILRKFFVCISNFKIDIFIYVFLEIRVRVFLGY